MTAAGALSGWVVVVTGGDSEIGSACALARAEAGPDVELLVHKDGDADAKLKGGIVLHGRLLGGFDRPIAFYNRGARDVTWGIGWVAFNHPNNRVLDRCEELLVALPGDEGGRNIACAASLIENGDQVHQ